MNGPDKHHMIALEADGGHVMCSGCRSSGEGLTFRPPGECPTPWLDRAQLLEELAKALATSQHFIAGGVEVTAFVAALQQRNADLVAALEGMVEYFPEGHSEGECFSVQRAKAVLLNATDSEVKP